MLAKRGITDERKALDDALSVWEDNALNHGKLFASGTDGRPFCVWDLRVVEGLPVHTEAMEQRGELSAWYDRMKEHVHKTAEKI